MTTMQTSAEPLLLDPATFNTMLLTTIEALPQTPGTTAEQRAEKREAALLAIAALHPRDPLEALQAARIVALHFHAMHDLACSIQPNVPGELQLRCEGRAMALGRQSDAMQANYLKRQKTEPARRPAGLPASAADAPQPQGQPQPQVRPQPALQPQPAPQPPPHATVADAMAVAPAAAAKPATAARPAGTAPAARPDVASLGASLDASLDASPGASPGASLGAPLAAHVPAPPSGDAVGLDGAALGPLVAAAEANPHAATRARAA